MVHNLGLVLHALGKVADAARAYEQAIALDPAGPRSLPQPGLGAGRPGRRRRRARLLSPNPGAGCRLRHGLAEPGQLLNRVGGGEAGLANCGRPSGAVGAGWWTWRRYSRLDRDAAAAPIWTRYNGPSTRPRRTLQPAGCCRNRAGPRRVGASGSIPRYAEALNNLGAVLQRNRLFSGKPWNRCKQALAIKPSGYLRTVHQSQRGAQQPGAPPRGTGLCGSAVSARRRRWRESWNSSGCIHRNLARFDVAEAHFRKALEYRRASSTRSTTWR